ncbi:hypothetical protein SLA2020_101360 [Shorea laevis]
MAYNSFQAHICQCFSRLATAKKHSVVTIAGSRRKTGQQFVGSVLTLATGLLQLGLRNGDVVAISALNSDWYLEWLLAVAYIGGIVAPLNYRWSFEEARSAMLTVSPVMLVTDESSDYWHSLLHSYAIPLLRWHVSLSSPSSDFMNKWNILPMQILMEHSAGSPDSQPLNYSYAPEGAVVICFTSGTTGRPKGVTIGHSALIVQSLAKVAMVAYSEDDVYLHTAPLCHIGGLSSAMAMLMVGACHVLIPKFEAVSALEAIEQHHVTSLITVPAIMADIISSIRLKETWKGRDCVKKILNGGGGLSNELIKDATKFFPRAKLLSAYGMTEACSSLTFMTLYDPTFESPATLLPMFAKTKSNPVHQQEGVCVGKPAPHVELKICSADSSHAGRILTRGPHLMLRYWDQIPENVSISSKEVWFDTGDIGFIDDSGNLWLIGRKNGRIKSGESFSRHPLPYVLLNCLKECLLLVEALLLEHPGVIAAVVVGIPDARLTEKIVACIRLRENWQWSNNNEHSAQGKELSLSDEILRGYCRQKDLSRFKIPRIFVLWRIPFPLTTTGKIRRDRVRIEVMSKLQVLPSSL